ncbi:ubiquitin-conjugating enzyme E2 Z-like [Onthophagus taurus]|uniref:ubiquitin-conjugating enzyme E2 Z-like n=1 Tax=Onthophagus taurus TaxID=166361 RepID=UPI000C204611|nr:ubiquitin-conjugating enzyme E2 Z-like [Onthophagus taurus]
MDIDKFTDWDPANDREADNLTPTANSRIRRDLMGLYTEPPPGIFAVGDETNLKFVYALIIGPMGTPYEGGFFYFMLKCPNDYPLQPPKVKFLTTDGGKCRFNPNLYKNGKVCISILGTWTGPAWSPAQQLTSLLVTIQSLLTEKPFFNEPGVKENTPGDASRYSDIVTYNTLKIAVCGMVDNECHLHIPSRLKEIIKKSFCNYYEQYMHIIDEKMHLDGYVYMDPFSMEKVIFNYKALKARFQAIHARISSQMNTT